MKSRWVLVLGVVTALSTPYHSTAQQQGFRFEEQPIPPEAWRNMDTHSPIDPRIHRHLQEKAEAERKAAERRHRLQQAMMQYNTVELRRAHQLRLSVGDPAVQVAVSASVQYLALRDIDGAASASQWLGAFKQGLNQRIQAMENPNPEMLKEAIVGTASLLVLNPYISDYPRQLDELKRTKAALTALGR
jgi:hypothetical protein